jgi:hypothetical protein
MKRCNSIVTVSDHEHYLNERMTALVRLFFETV